jgi:hypothetical protein
MNTSISFDGMEHNVHSASSLPGLTRQSINPAKWMDARVKPAHDE